MRFDGMIAASVAIGLAQAAVPITRPYTNITEFARFDGNYSDAIRIFGLTTNDAAADNGMAFEVIYRHPDVARSDLPQVADTTVFTLEKTRSFVFDECRAHPYITPPGQLPAVNTLCMARTTAVQCAGPRRGVLYENRGAAIGAYGTKPFNPALEQARQSVEAGRGDPNLNDQCIWVSASASRASLSLWTRLDSDNQPYMQLEYSDRRRATLDVNGNLVGHRFDVPRYNAPPSNVPDREYYGTNGTNFNQWHHAVINVIPTPGSTTGATVEFWMDGSLWLTSTDDDDFRGGGVNRYDLMYIGGRPLGGRGFIGDVAKFRVYRQSLQSAVITSQLFRNGAMNPNQANSYMATEWPTPSNVAALAQQVNVNRRAQQPFQVRSLHFDGAHDTLKLPPMQLSTDFTVEIMFKIEYDHPRNWVLCQFATAGADETSRFIIKRLVDGSNDPEVPDSLEITYQRDNDVGTNPRNNAITRVVRTDPILVSDVWHHLVVAVTSAYDIHVRVDGTLVSQGQFFRTAPGLVSRYANRQGSVNWDNSYLGSMNACANFFTGDIGFLRVYQAALSYSDVRRLFSNPRGGLFAYLQRFKFEFQTRVDLTTTGVSNTGSSSGATHGLAQASETAEALRCPSAPLSQNAPVWTSGPIPVPYLNQIQYSARFGGSYLGATGTQSVTGSGMRLSPLDVAEGGATFEVIYRHNNNSDDLMSYVNDVLVDLRDTGTILTSRCEKQREPTNQGSCTAATSRLACIGNVPWRQRSPYPVTAANGGTTYAPVSYGTGAGVTDGPCVWVDRSIDDVSVTMKYARTRPASNETDVPQLQMLFIYKDPRYNEYNSEGTGREYSVQIQTDPFTIDIDFGRWHHVFVTAPTGADGYWQIWLDNRVISGRNQALRDLGLYDDFRPGFISGTPIKAASFTNNHLGSSMGQWNTHQGNVAAFRVYPQTLTVPQVVACFNSTRGHNAGVGSLEVEPSMNYDFTNRSIAASGVRFMPAVKTAIRTSLFEGEREIYTFDDLGDDVSLPAMPIPDAFSVAITFKPMLDIQRSFGLFSLHQMDAATSPPNVDWGSYVEILGLNYTHGRITVARPGRSWVTWTGNWNIAFRTINQLVVTVIPTGEVHARLNGVVLCHGGLEGAVPTAGSQPDQFSGGYINALKQGVGNMNGIYGAVKIYNRALSYPEVAALFTDDANGQDSYLSHSWSFAPDLNYPGTIRDTVGSAHGTLMGNPTHGLLFTRLDLGFNDYVTFTGEREDTLALPDLTLETGDAGFSVETIFQWADPCPINDLAFCAHIRDTCTHTLPEYVDAVLTGNPNFPGLQECVTSVCCYCDYGYSREPECNAAQVDWGAVIGTSTLNAGCALLNTGVFAPEFVIGNPSAPAWAFSGYTASCSDYTQCPFQVESTAELAAGRAETQNDTSTALCKYLEGKCTSDLNSIVVGASDQEECVTNMCCFCEMGHSDKAVCDSAEHTFQFSSGDLRARTMTMNAMCRELVADAPQYDLQCADSPFNAQRFQGSEVFGMRNRGADIRDQCLPIDASSSSDAAYCALFREIAVQQGVGGRRACCGSETCNLTVSDAFPTRNMAFEPVNQQCAWVGADNDDNVFALSRVIEQESNVGRGSLRSGFMQARYVDKSRFERRPDGGALIWGAYVNGEPIKEGGDRFDKWHHAILNVDSDGAWTYWVNGEVASGLRVSGANRMDGTDTQARRGSVRTPTNPAMPSRSRVMSTNFNSNRLGWKLEGKIGRMKVFPRHLTAREIESSFSRGANIVGEVFSLEDSMPFAFRNQLGLPRDGYENANNNLGLRFDRFEDSARMGQTAHHEHISITDGVKLPTSFTIRMLVKPYMIQNHRTSLLGMFTSNTDPSRPELYASMLIVNRLQNGGVRVAYKASIDDITVDEQTLGGLFVHDEVHQLIIQVTAANLPARQAQVTIIFDGKVVNHGAYQATPAIPGAEVVMATARINGNIGDEVYPNPMTFYAVHIYEDAFGYDMRSPETGAFDASKLRYNWTFSNRGELTAGIVSNSAPGYPSATGAGEVQGDATVENGPGFRRGLEQSRINREIVQYKVLPGSDSDRVNNVLSASGQANAGGVDLGRAGTTFEMIFNTTVDTRESAAAQSQHLFDMYDNNDTPNDVTDDRRMRLYQTTIPVVNGDSSQTFLRFEWMDGAREAQADNLMAGPNEGFGFILESAPHWPATYSQRPHHIILTVTEEGTWTMWQDGEVISGYLSAIANPDRESLENQAQQRYLASPGGVTAEPLCRRAFGPNCGTTFSTVVVGGSYTSLRGGGQDAFQGDISMFRVLPHSVTAFQAQRMYYEGPDISVSKCNYTTSCTYESDIPIVNWVPCKQTAIIANVSLSIEGDACNDYNYSSATDSCGADGYCSVRVGFARRDSNTTSMPGTSASSGDDASDLGTGVMIAAVVAALLLCIIVAVAVVKVKKLKQLKAEGHKEVSFENPMYDEGGKENPAFEGDGNYDEPNYAGTGYMDVPGGEVEGSGYMDVSPSGAGDDNDDI